MTESKMTIGKFRGNLYRNVHNSLKLNTVTAMAKGVVSDPKFTNYPSPSNPVSNFHPFLLGHHPHTPPPPLLALNVRLGASQVHNKSKLVQGDLTFYSITLSNEIKMMRCDSDSDSDQTPDNWRKWNFFLCTPECNSLLHWFEIHTYIHTYKVISSRISWKMLLRRIYEGHRESIMARTPCRLKFKKICAHQKANNKILSTENVQKSHLGLKLWAFKNKLLQTWAFLW